MSGLTMMEMLGIERVIYVATVMTKQVNTLEPFFINVKLKVIQNFNSIKAEVQVIHALILEQMFGLAKCRPVNIANIRPQLKAIKLKVVT